MFSLLGGVVFSFSFATASEINWNVSFEQRELLVDEIDEEVEVLQDMALEAFGRATVYEEDLEASTLQLVDESSVCFDSLDEISSTIYNSQPSEFSQLKVGAQSEFERCEYKIEELDQVMSSELRFSVSETLEQGFSAKSELKTQFQALLNELNAEVTDINAFLADETQEAKDYLAPRLLQLNTSLAASALLVDKIDTVNAASWTSFNTEILQALDAIDESVFEVYSALAED